MKKWITLVLALVMALSLCACAETEDPNTTDNSAAASDTKTVTCLTSYTRSNGYGYPHKYEITYETDGVHVKPPLHVIDDGNVYDWAGKLLHVLGYDENGKIIKRVDHSYDQNGNQTEILMTSLLDGFPPSRMRYAYDADGRLTSISYDEADDLVYRTMLYSYDDLGFLKEAVDLYITEDGTTEEREKHVFTCDDSGEILTCERYDTFEEKSLLCTFVCTYDDQGRLISNVCNRGVAAFGASRYYTYDAQGRLSSFKLNEEVYLTYTYDDAGRLAKITDAATGWETTLHYTEITLDAELAAKAEAWTLDGALKAFVETPEFVY